MEEKDMDIVMVPLGLLLLAIYHLWLFLTIYYHPSRTVIGLNAQVRQRWVRAMMADPTKNGMTAVQTLRNSIMASTVLATTAITITSLISVFVSATSTSVSSALIYGNKSSVAHSVKYFSISLCLILAFLCNVQSIRYYAHVSFLVTQPPVGASQRQDYVDRSLYRGNMFWSLGLRSFYVSFTLFLWIFGPIPMLASSVVMCFLLFFLDTTTKITRGSHLPIAAEEHNENCEV